MPIVKKRSSFEDEATGTPSRQPIPRTFQAGNTPFSSKRFKVDDDSDELRYSPMKASVVKEEPKTSIPVVLRKYLRKSKVVAVMAFNSFPLKDWFDHFGFDVKGKN